MFVQQFVNQLENSYASQLSDPNLVPLFVSCTRLVYVDNHAETRGIIMSKLVPHLLPTKIFLSLIVVPIDFVTLLTQSCLLSVKTFLEWAYLSEISTLAFDGL